MIDMPMSESQSVASRLFGEQRYWSIGSDRLGSPHMWMRTQHRASEAKSRHLTSSQAKLIQAKPRRRWADRGRPRTAELEDEAVDGHGRNEAVEAHDVPMLEPRESAHLGLPLVE